MKSVSFRTEFREITGLIGPNGAGKTTIVRMIATLLQPDSGSISVCGIDVKNDPESVRRKISVLPEVSGLYQRLTALENVEFYARFYGIREVRNVIEKYIDLFALREKMNAPAGTLSLGMRKKLAVIRAIVHDPEVLVLDEPLSGLDPDARIAFKQLLKMFKDQGKAVFLSSHEMLKVENLCDKVILIDEGRILVDEYMQVLKERFKKDGLQTLEEIYMTLRRSNSSA